MKTVRVGLVLAILVLAARMTDADEINLVALYQSYAPSVGALYAQGSTGDLSYLCTVTAIGKHKQETILLTANHCVKKDVAYMVTFDGKGFDSAHVWKVPAEAIDPNKYRRQYGEPEVDAALFLTRTGAPPISLGTTTKVGEQVFTIGFPLGVAKIQYEGRVAGIFDRPGSDKDGYFMLQIFGAPGSSGSAVIEVASHKIVGVLVSAKQDMVGLPVIFATPIRYLDKLMEIPR